MVQPPDPGADRGAGAPSAGNDRPLARGGSLFARGRQFVQGGGLFAGGAPGAVDAERPVRTYLWQSLVATLLCCLPTGAIALVYAAMAQNRLQTGDLAGARDASDRARRWCVVSVIAFVVVMLLYVVAVVIIVAIVRDRHG